MVLQLLIGILDCIPGRPNGVQWAESSLMLVWNFCYDLSIGPVCFVIISEASATRVRSKSIAVATAAQGLLGIVMTVAIPYSTLSVIPPPLWSKRYETDSGTC